MYQFLGFSKFETAKIQGIANQIIESRAGIVCLQECDVRVLPLLQQTLMDLGIESNVIDIQNSGKSNTLITMSTSFSNYFDSKTVKPEKPVTVGTRPVSVSFIEDLTILNIHCIHAKNQKI